MAVIGIESFKAKFHDYSDCYTVIGGTACDILMAAEDFDFRATKDIDMIILLEDRYQEFAKMFWEYIKEGGYRCGWKQSDDIHFYRFTEPMPGYPVQIELFSRKPDYHLESDTAIVPIHISDDVSSLSAILLNDDFYTFMMKGRRVVDGICVLDAPYIIPFKMYAWLNLLNAKENGEHVNERDLKKHKYDVFRLLQIVTIGDGIHVDGIVGDTVRVFLEKLDPEPLNLRSIGLPFDKDQGVGYLKQLYRL